MTPKEKAQELVEKMHDYQNMLWTEGKHCALIAVDELIEHCNYANKWYWQDVKKEIEKL